VTFFLIPEIQRLQSKQNQQQRIRGIPLLKEVAREKIRESFSRACAHIRAAPGCFPQM
jgi:hypothetical protein